MGLTSATVWPLLPHTQMKHELLRCYLGAWFPIMGRHNGRLLYLDGFAGPGRYEAGEDGSPLVAIKSLLDHDRPPACDVRFLFLEADQKRCENLRTEILALESERQGFPANVKWTVENTTFKAKASDIVAEMTGANQELIPTLALVDPFGFSGVPLDLIRDLLASPRCEIVFNFMFNSLNRWITDEKSETHLAELFGGDGYKGADGLTGEPRRRFLHDLYAQQLRMVAGFPYVRWFEMVKYTGHLSNSIFFGTRNLTGFDRMKQAMWKIDPLGQYRFSERSAMSPTQQCSLFEQEADFSPLRALIVNEFAGQTVDVSQINDFVIASTSFTSSQWNKNVMRPLQMKENLVTPVSGQNTPGTFPKGCVVRFLPNPKP